MRLTTSVALINAVLFAVGILVCELVFSDGNLAKALGAAIFYATGAFSVPLAMWSRFRPGDWVRDTRSQELHIFRYRIGNVARVLTRPQQVEISLDNLELSEAIEKSEADHRKWLAGRQNDII